MRQRKQILFVGYATEYIKPLVKHYEKYVDINLIDLKSNNFNSMFRYVVYALRDSL